MLYRLLATGLISGAVAGVVMTVVQMFLVAPLIFEAEQYEISGSTATKAAGAESPAGPVHVHNDSSAHIHDVWKPADSFERAGFTFLANLLSGIAFGLLLATALTLYGRAITIAQGLIWGAAGFVSFALLPALGLPPELPGAAAGALQDRQIWWLATAIASAGGLAALILAAGWTTRLAGMVVLLILHIIGAPHAVKGEVGLAPPELAAQFVVNSLFTSLVMWLVIGAAMAYVMTRMDAKQNSRVGAGNSIT